MCRKFFQLASFQSSHDATGRIRLDLLSLLDFAPARTWIFAISLV